jgi:hypothetical protein
MKPYGDSHVPPDEPIDLLNVAFENPRKIRAQVDGNVGGTKKKKKFNALQDDTPATERCDTDYLVPDRSAGLYELEELRRLCPSRQWNFVSSLTGVHINCLIDSGISGRDRCTVHGIPGRSTDCEIDYVALPYRHGPGQYCDSSIIHLLSDVHSG